LVPFTESKDWEAKNSTIIISWSKTLNWGFTIRLGKKLSDEKRNVSSLVLEYKLLVIFILKLKLNYEIGFPKFFKKSFEKANVFFLFF
jgi:hypothetical protein